jgi:transglutaminase-like putative cysteine protease
MLKRWIARGLTVAGWMACAPMMAAPKQQAVEERPAQVERMEISFRVNDDGSYTETREQAIKVLKEDALEEFKNSYVGYSTSIQKVEVLEAYTLKSDGRRIEVPKSNYQVQTNGGHGDGGPVFSDETSMTVVFPELAVGDTTVFKYRLIGSKPLFDRQFSDVEVFSRETYYGKVDVTFDVPTTLPAKLEAWHMEKVRDATSGGRRISHYRFSNTQPVKSGHAAALFEFERQPGLVYSTFASYGDIARAYGERATPKAAVTPRIAKLADEISGKRSEPREIAIALYEWVSTNITYAGNCIGLGAVVPHDLDFVLDNRMGDCKDHATLLQALLTAKGVKSTQALINSGNLYRLTRTPEVSMVNHVINYLPQWDMYVDATAKGIPFGMLPMGDMGKPVFLVDGYREGTRTPMIAPGSNRQVVRTRLKVAADGSIDGQSEIELSGMYAVSSRAGFRGVTKDQAADYVNRYFQRMGAGGSASIEMADAQALSDHYRYQLSFKAGQVLPMPGAFALQPLFPSEAPVARFASQANDEINEEGETTCTSGSSQEEYVIEFATPAKVVAVPPSVDLSGAAFSYKASYEVEGNTVKVKRVLEDLTPGPTCQVQYNRDYKAFMQKVLTNLKAQVVYQ